jgi:hypothetical protein
MSNGPPRTETRPKVASDPLLVAGLLVGLAVTVVMTLTRTLEFGSSSGGFVYGYLKPFRFTSVLAFIVIAPLALLTVHFASRNLQRHEVPAVAACLVMGSTAQLLLRRLTPFSMTRITRNGEFYDTARRYGAGRFLRDYVELAPGLDTHPRANMPGKVLLFDALLPLSTSPAVLSVLLALLSSLGGIGVYVLSRSLFRSKRVALYAMMLYLFLPARLYFLPLLNTVTPLLLLALVIVLVWYLDTGRRSALVLLGGLLYLTAFFEPTPLVLFALFAAVALVVGVRRELPLRDAAALVVLPIVVFLLVHACMVWATGFDLFAALAHTRDDATTFNRISGRPYFDFLVPNVREFLVNSGTLASLLAIGSLPLAVRRLRTAVLERRGAVLDPFAVVALAAFATLFVVSLSGISRGEVSRLWIFLSAFMAIAAARMCAALPGPGLFYGVLTATILQVSLTIGPVGFAIQGLYCPGCEGVPRNSLGPTFDLVFVCAAALVCLGVRRGRRSGDLRLDP